MKRTDHGFSLIEIVIATVLAFVLLLAASNLMINFGKFTANVNTAEGVLHDANTIFEEIVSRITAANKVTIMPEGHMDTPSTDYPAGCVATRCIQIRMDRLLPIGCDPNSVALATACRYSPTDLTNDAVYTYWARASATVPGTFEIFRSGDTDDPADGKRIATGITTLRFVRNVAAQLNRVTVTLRAQHRSGAEDLLSAETLETTAIMRGRSAT
ncbi:MAG: prepilin-type N-terminal cleavage/methylation domain-containing protein [Candidatus Omnitrophota bacterium]